MVVTRKKDAGFKKVLMHRVADVRGGVGIKTSVLGGDVLLEGSVVGAPVNGICEVLKVAVISSDATSSDTSYRVAKGSHFKAGEFVTSGVSKKAYAITAIDKSNADYDVITVGTTLGVAIAKGGYLIAAKAEASTNASKLAVEPFGITGTTEYVDTKANMQMDVWVIAVTKDAAIPADVLASLKGIINY